MKTTGNGKKRAMRAIPLAVAGCALIGCLAGCGSQAANNAPAGSDGVRTAGADELTLAETGPVLGFGSIEGANNDTAVIGQLEVQHADSAEASTSGDEIVGSEEAQHQQELIAGGNSGAVTSQNLPELTGIASRDHYTSLGDGTGLPPAIPHAIEGSEECMACHEGADAMSGYPLPASHAGITVEQCQTCHQQA